MLSVFAKPKEKPKPPPGGGRSASENDMSYKNHMAFSMAVGEAIRDGMDIEYLSSARMDDRFGRDERGRSFWGYQKGDVLYLNQDRMERDGYGAESVTTLRHEHIGAQIERNGYLHRDHEDWIERTAQQYTADLFRELETRVPNKRIFN